MYPYKYPFTISNPEGEELTFHSIVDEDGVKKINLSNKVQPGAGPPMHVHFKQDESLTVKKGKLGYQIFGEDEKFAEKGETILFKNGVPHRFWNAGKDILECDGWVKPANSFDYFLPKVYESMTKADKPEGDPFDSAFLLVNYKSEYDMLDIPTFIKKVIMPVTVAVGRILGKYKHFTDAPEPIK